MKKYGCIYKITHKDSGKSYIGQSIVLDENDIPTKRWGIYKGLHCKGQPKLYRALKKYSPNNFTFEVLEYSYSKKEIDCRECYWMGKFDTIAKGYNVKEGGSHGGKKHSQETRDKMSISHKGKKMSQKARHNMSLAQKKMPQETKDKMSLAKKGKTSNRKGVVLSQETKDKMSLAHKAYWAHKKAF